MKYLAKACLFSACNLFIGLAGYLHWDGVSFFLFGEREYPSEK